MIKRFIFVLVLFFLLLASFTMPLQAEEDIIKTFQEVLYYIQQFHIDEPDMDSLIGGAIEGMVGSLDPFSQYMTTDEYDEMQLEFEGHFGGIGIVITPDLTIISPIKGTPGEKTGLKPEDQIMAINGETTKGMTLKQAVEIMRGEPGTSVDLTIKREGEKGPLEFNIIRSDIEVPYVEWEMKNEQIGYVFISQFVQNVGEKVQQGIDELTQQGARALILDLRNDPGGLLTEAITVASNFIADGTVVSVKKKYGDDEIYEVSPLVNSTELPLVVLINQGSASASEIVSGAIQDHERGKLIGMKTFGKGTVQWVIPLSDGSALRLTTGKYYTPAGRFIHEKGIEPDIEVEYDPEYDGDKQLESAINYLESSLQDKQVEYKQAG